MRTVIETGQEEMKMDMKNTLQKMNEQLKTDMTAAL